MKLSPERRDFLKQSLVGAAALGLGGRAMSPSAWAATNTGADRRRELIHAAHFGRKGVAQSREGMAICSHPLATQEAVNVLRDGGNACDAALTASVAQTVLEPHMTTITGVLSMLYFDAATGETTYVNGSVNAPAAALPGFSPGDLLGGRGVAVPGFWGGFEAAHARHGKASRERVLRPAIDYARHGFETHPFLWGEIFVMCQTIGLTEQGREIYMPDNALPRPGDKLVQARAADTLEALLAEGNDYFYRGGFAEELVEVVENAGGVLTLEDMAAYEARWQEPAWGTYRGYDVAGAPPPDHGGSHMIEILNMVELLDLQRLGPPTDSPEALYQMARIVNTVYSEGSRQRDPKSHYLPLETLLSKEYARIRYDLLQMDGELDDESPVPPPGSNHVTVADADGNIATVLHSCMSLPWTNGLFAGGVSVCAAGAHFLRVMPDPGDRISAYVCPNIVFRDGRPVLASGSPSVGLLANILQNTVNLLDFGLPIEEAVHRPRFGGNSYERPGSLMIEVDIDESVRGGAAQRGIQWHVVNPWNWHHGSFEGIHVTEAGYRACGDPRRNAMAIGV